MNPQGPVQCHTVRDMALGGDHSCALLTDGLVYCWGNNTAGELGDRQAGTQRATPTPVEGLTNVVQLSSGIHHACAKINNGSVRCWGDNTFGQSNPLNVDAGTGPVEVINTMAMSLPPAKGNTSCVITTLGEVMCWGVAIDGQGYDVNNLYREYNGVEPIVGYGMSSGGVVAESGALGSYHACFNTSDGQLRCFGLASTGQTCTDAAPAQSYLPPGSTDGVGVQTTVSLGDYHTCFVDSEVVTCCGSQDATGVQGNANLPTPVGISSAAHVGTGFRHTCADTTAGTVQCIGDNSVGQCGVPANGVVANLNPVGQVYVGWQHNCAVSPNRMAIQCWGNNARAQLGTAPWDAGVAGCGCGPTLTPDGGISPCLCTPTPLDVVFP